MNGRIVCFLLVSSLLLLALLANGCNASAQAFAPVHAPAIVIASLTSGSHGSAAAVRLALELPSRVIVVL